MGLRPRGRFAIMRITVAQYSNFKELGFLTAYLAFSFNYHIHFHHFIHSFIPPPLIHVNGPFLPAIRSTLIQRSKLALAMVSSHDFSFKNGSDLSVTNDDRTLQWLLDSDWLLTSCLFSLIYLARKMRRNARESDNLFISSMYAPEMCNTSYTYQ